MVACWNAVCLLWQKCCKPSKQITKRKCWLQSSQLCPDDRRFLDSKHCATLSHPWNSKERSKDIGFRCHYFERKDLYFSMGKVTQWYPTAGKINFQLNNIDVILEQRQFLALLISYITFYEVFLFYSELRSELRNFSESVLLTAQKVFFNAILSFCDKQSWKTV